MAAESALPKTTSAINFARQAEKLSLRAHDFDGKGTQDTSAVEARFITPADPVIETANGGRLPTVPLREALELNRLREEVEGPGPDEDKTPVEGVIPLEAPLDEPSPQDYDSQQSARPEASLRTAIPPSRTHPLFPQLPLYGPSTFLRDLQCFAFRCSSAVLSLAFLAVIVLGSAFTSIPLMFRHIGLRLIFRDPDARRSFHEEEKRRKKARKEEARAWKRQRRRDINPTKDPNEGEEEGGHDNDYEPTEGGKDPLVCDVGYYARRVGLNVEDYKVQTEDGFIIDLLHVYNPREYTPASASHRDHHGPSAFPKVVDDTGWSYGESSSSRTNGKQRYPVLLVHGLLQSAGAYCANDDDSLAFFLCKSGYDVWLGNNRCGFHPQHQLLKYTDPRMWNWNIRQMGVMDLPALISRVLWETGFPKLGLICHSQGTTETFVALAKEQRPDLGNKISVFCALAPAVYAGPLIGKMYFKFMRIISPGMFRVIFGIHAFIPFMMTMHAWLPGRLYGALGYRVFSFLFNWTDDRWDQGIRDRLFLFAPVYVSAESMRWWLGRECFATQKCILATREEGKQEDEEDEEEDYYVHSTEHSTEQMLQESGHEASPERGHKAWYDEQVPPFALWVAGSDELVDGRRLLRRFERRREPYVRVVHSKIIEEYEHLDVLWALDSIEKVGKEVREVLWKTAPPSARDSCQVPKDCEGVLPWTP
ncbi:hypothetical protein MMC28_002517 [Mycoblastus sanguinarius]|nr:hypothetical protein [Mycoblastus sanguinarius]